MLEQGSRGPGRASRANIFRGLSDRDVAEILRSCTRMQYLRDAQVVRESEQDNNIYLLENGLLGVAQYAASGKEVGFRELKPGDHFGEISAIDGGTRSASVVALQDSVVTVMPFSVFESLMHENSAVRIAVLRHLTGLVRRLSERVYEYSTLGVNNRIQAELLRLADLGEDLDGVARIHQPPTHAQLAGRVSCNREAVSRELGRLEKLGYLRRLRGRWEIENREALRRLVEDSQASR